MIHYFMDYDLYTYEDYDIQGDDYNQLMDLCFSYCDYFSLMFKSKDVKCSILPYKVEIKTPDNIAGFMTSEYFERRFFKCNIESKDYMLSITNNLYSLANTDGKNNKPEDPIFYREDGTVFFWSMIHEGICVLSNRDNEDVANIVSKRGWKIHNEDGKILNLIPKYFFNHN